MEFTANSVSFHLCLADKLANLNVFVGKSTAFHHLFVKSRLLIGFYTFTVLFLSGKFETDFVFTRSVKYASSALSPFCVFLDESTV